MAQKYSTDQIAETVHKGHKLHNYPLCVYARKKIPEGIFGSPHKSHHLLVLNRHNFYPGIKRKEEEERILLLSSCNLLGPIFFLGQKWIPFIFFHLSYAHLFEWVKPTSFYGIVFRKFTSRVEKGGCFPTFAYSYYNTVRTLPEIITARARLGYQMGTLWVYDISQTQEVWFHLAIGKYVEASKVNPGRSHGKVLRWRVRQRRNKKHIYDGI